MVLGVQLDEHPIEHAQLARRANELLERCLVGVLLCSREQERVVAAPSDEVRGQGGAREAELRAAEETAAEATGEEERAVEARAVEVRAVEGRERGRGRRHLRSYIKRYGEIWGDMGRYGTCAAASGGSSASCTLRRCPPPPPRPPQRCGARSSPKVR